jgi:Uncharacterized conserved domain (SAYSvFN)
MVRGANEWSLSFKVAMAVTVAVGIVLIYCDLGVLAFFLFVLVAIFGFGLREKFDNETIASAYSVFNKDGRAIVGGLTADQFDRQLRGSMPGEGRANNDPLNGPIAEAQQRNDSRSNQRNSSEISCSEREIRRKAALDAAERRQKTE